MSSIILALVIGGIFGATLDRIGATSPDWIGKMLALKHLHLMKTILLAIGVGSTLMFVGQMLGLVDVAHMSVKSAYVGVFIGGIMLGIGWAASGYCPGTGVCAAASGRKDALFFIAGGLLGAAAYMATYPAWEASGLLNSIAGGKVTLGAVPGSKFSGVSTLPGDILGVILGLILIGVAFVLPDRLVGGPTAAEVPAE
ncbi:YeeE/YedE thiosulfate transporter family protein [Sulfitobacter donghicola]|uniref:Membrane protein n=1 Tax=Sulfitobacter donghicola DSW-25 = KCTC 12864 = JCM 14565 TaxID=1300350 RepID=A0A073IEP6_9RHOB|nr:YeeE/YedE thiosulfate transporter family protein [Sulfitobacter donghicola]KEJ88838.1 membrane protein [Sulfitobacter donghicola DSW-25 = KCTC 12864 = JCM 14565]KIN68634.1 Membrane protein [Sulfitobacter donghicola DSW-25 = KCTC 12864 = JCM 14565]